MPIEIMVALISFGGVLTSVAISLFTTKRSTRTEMHKVRTEILQNYTGKLLDKRLDAYPRLYKLTSTLLKIIEFEPEKFTYAELEEFLNNLAKWDSEYAILLSKDANGKLYNLRKRIMEAFKNKRDRELRNIGLIDNLIPQIEELEVALKNDLGIFKVEYSDTDKRFTSYRESA